MVLKKENQLRFDTGEEVIKMTTLCFKSAKEVFEQFKVPSKVTLHPENCDCEKCRKKTGKLPYFMLRDD
jgi:hypothetical protein